jgi:hypothetical protein
MKGEFEKRSQAWVPKKPNEQGVYVAEDWVKLTDINEANKDFPFLFRQIPMKMGDVQDWLNKLDEWRRKWWGVPE